MMNKSDAVRYAEQHRDIAKLLPSGKLQFIHSGMEFPPHADLTTLESYATGKAYRRQLARKKNEAYDFDQHLPYIVPHKYRDEKHFLYCTLTNKTLPRHRDVIVSHTNGKKYKRRFQEAEQKRGEGKQRMAEQKKGRRHIKDEKEEDGIMQTEGVPDVLEGLLSSDEDSGSGDYEMQDHAQTEAREHRDRSKRNVEKSGDAHVRRSSHVDEVMQDVQNDIESETIPAKGSPNGVQRTSCSLERLDCQGQTPPSVKARQFAAIKRRRPKTPVPKKVRQPRQKRKTSETISEDGA